MSDQDNSLNQPVMSVARTDVTRLRSDISVREALDYVRERGVGDKIVYFYVVDADDRLVGVLPTRRLLTAPLDQRLHEIMLGRVVTIPSDATVMDACETFLLYKFLALPVVDDQRRIVGMVDVGVLTDEVFDVTERERMHEMFESIGFRVSQVRDASPLRAFRFRFPWLLATVGSGTACALLAGAYAGTLAKSLVLAFFLTLVLGLGESVSMQSMTVTIQLLRSKKPTLGWYVRAFRREASTAVLLGAACGLIVGLTVWIWRGVVPAALTIGGSIVLSLLFACFLGLSVPVVLHVLRLDLKIASGPMTLALADIFTVVVYFTMAALVL